MAETAAVAFPALVGMGAPTTVLNVAAAIALGLIPAAGHCIASDRCSDCPGQADWGGGGGLLGKLLSNMGISLSVPGASACASRGAVSDLKLSSSDMDIFSSSSFRGSLDRQISEKGGESSDGASRSPTGTTLGDPTPVSAIDTPSIESEPAAANPDGF